MGFNSAFKGLKRYGRTDIMIWW